MGRKIINISVPPALFDFVETRVRNGDFASVSEYFRELINLDKHRQEILRNEELRRQNTPGYPFRYRVPPLGGFD